MSVIDQFCAEYHAYNDISADRRTAQRRVLIEFEATLAGPLIDATADDLRAFLLAQVNNGLAPNTVNKARNMIRPFFTWAWEKKIVTAETLMSIRTVKPPRGANQHGTPRPYDRKELAQLWRDLDARYPYVEETFLRRWQRGTSPWRRVQTHAQRLQAEAIIALALYGGVRRNEIFELEYEGMHFENEYVVVSGARKNRHAESFERAVPMVPALHDAIEAWFEFRALLAPPHDRPWLSLWHQHREKPLQLRTFNTLLSKIGPWEYHRMRHTAATEMLRAGYALEIVQKIMGHASIHQTLKYTRLLNDDVLAGAARSQDRFVANIARTRAA